MTTYLTTGCIGDIMSNQKSKTLKTLEEFIAYYGETFGPIRFNESNPDYDYLFTDESGSY